MKAECESYSNADSILNFPAIQRRDIVGPRKTRGCFKDMPTLEIACSPASPEVIIIDDNSLLSVLVDFQRMQVSQHAQFFAVHGSEVTHTPYHLISLF